MTYPSEQTIVVNATRFLLNELMSPRAWAIFCTTNQESALGWDASLEGLKQLYIQYKGISYAYAGSPEVRVNVDPGQRTVLNAFAAAVVTPAYYGFCDYQNYAQIGGGFAAAPPTVFFDRCAYVNELDLPPGTAFLRGSNATGWDAHAIGGGIIAPLPFLTGPQFAHEVRICNIGAAVAPLEYDIGERLVGPAQRVTRLFAPIL